MRKQSLGHLLTIMTVAVLSMGFVSCGDDDESSMSGGNFGKTTEEVENRDLLGYYYFSGNIAPSFALWSDGTVSGSSGNGYSFSATWAYDTENKILAFSDGHAFTVKLLTSEMMSAEWSSVKYGTRVDTWSRKSCKGSLDPGWEKLIIGTWKNANNGDTFTFTRDGKFICTLHTKSSDYSDFTFSGTYSFVLGKDDRADCIELDSDDKYSFNKSPLKIKLAIYVLEGNKLQTSKKIPTTIGSSGTYNYYERVTSIEGVPLNEYTLEGTFSYQK